MSDEQLSFLTTTNIALTRIPPKKLRESIYWLIYSIFLLHVDNVKTCHLINIADTFDRLLTKRRNKQNYMTKEELLNILYFMSQNLTLITMKPDGTPVWGISDEVMEILSPFKDSSELPLEINKLVYQQLDRYVHKPA